MSAGARLRALRATQPYRHLLVARLLTGMPLLAIGLAHVFSPQAPMQPLIEAAGFPAPALLAPVAVALEIAGGVLLLLGAYARLGALCAIPAMTGALYAHLVIDAWPNGPANEPPLALPLIVLAGAAYVLWRGAGRWSLDARTQRSPSR